MQPRAVEHFGEHKRQGCAKKPADEGGGGGGTEGEVRRPEHLRGEDAAELAPGDVEEEPEERPGNEENTQRRRNQEEHGHGGKETASGCA